MPITSSLMGLIIPITGVDSGLVWEQSIVSSLNILDGHTHAPGSGSQINPDGLNINADLPMNGNNLTITRSVRFQAQSASLSNPTDLGCLYEAGEDLYYNDGLGNQIRITQSGSLAGAAGTITGLPSGTASAAYAAGTFTFQRATSTPANIDGASYVLRNNVASSKGLTLAPPNAMGADYSLTLPALPGVTNIMSLDTSGNMAAAINVDNTTLQLNANALSVKTITTSNIVVAGVANPATVGNFAQSNGASGTFTTTSATPVNVTGLSCTLTTKGNPVLVALRNDAVGSGNISVINSSTNASASLSICRGGSPISTQILNIGAAASGGILTIGIPASSLSTIDLPAAGTYTYTVKVSTNGSVNVNNAYLMAYELK